MGSVFTISELVASVGGTQSLASFIVDNEMVATRRKGNKEVLKSYKVEDFDTVGFLGQGSFGSVKLVRCKEKEASPLPDEYALKSMSKEYIYSSGQVDHTLDERKIVVTLSHPNVLKVFSTFQSCDELFLLSEYIAGCDLWSLIHSDAARTGESHGLPPPFVKFYTANIVEGLGHIHSKGIAYRDLKPENVMVDADGYLKIIDFGFAKKIPFTVEIEGSVQVRATRGSDAGEQHGGAKRTPKARAHSSLFFVHICDFVDTCARSLSSCQRATPCAARRSTWRPSSSRAKGTITRRTCGHWAS